MCTLVNNTKTIQTGLAQDDEVFNIDEKHKS